MAERASAAVSLLVDQRFDHPEGIVWDARAERLLWVDIFAGVIAAHDLGSGRTDLTELGRAVGSVAPRRDGGLVCAVREGFGLLSGDGDFSLVTEQLRDTPYLQLNDGAVDARGRFWAGTTCLEPEAHPDAGTLYCLRPETLQPTEELHGINVSNGIGWSPDGRRCYYVDSATGRIDSFAFDPDVGALSEPRPLVEVRSRPGRPGRRYRWWHMGGHVRGLGGAALHPVRAARPGRAPTGEPGDYVCVRGARPEHPLYRRVCARHGRASTAVRKSRLYFRLRTWCAGRAEPRVPGVTPALNYLGGLGD